jgi:putative Mg2+ transporter-C (MgtC) family protein
MDFVAEDVLRVGLALLAGGLIGLEREYRDKAAGFRTLIFICVGAALFTVLSTKLAGGNDATRIAANIVSGVGFLGAGVILRDGGKVIGLTTAATIWLTAALGMAFGGGYYLLAAIILGISLVVLWAFPWLENRVDNATETRTYEVVCPCNPEKIPQLDDMVLATGLTMRDRHQTKAGERMTYHWTATGAPAKHDHLVKTLFADPDVLEFKF